jgi:hypothetical protein
LLLESRLHANEGGILFVDFQEGQVQCDNYFIEARLLPAPRKGVVSQPTLTTIQGESLMKTLNRFWAILSLGLAFGATSVLHGQGITTLNDFTAGRAKVIAIDDAVDWTGTGITLQAGDTVVVLVRGFAAPNGLTVPSTVFWTGPEGWGGNIGGPVPTAAYYSMIGKIGTSGTPFYVGSACHFIAQVSGQLYLGTNDFIHWDNVGHFVAHIYLDNRGIVSVGDNSSLVPSDASVYQNYPNPFNPSTTISFELPQQGRVQVNIYNSVGQLVRVLANEQRAAGLHSIVWDGKDNAGSAVTSGTYFYQVQVGDLIQAKKMLLLK